MSEDEYMKLMNFGFYGSFIRILTLEAPLRPNTWWVGDYSSISHELNLEQHWLTVINPLIVHHGDSETSGSYLIALKGQVSVWQLLRSVQDVGGDSLDICTSGFEFIKEQIFSPQHQKLCCKLSDLEAHFKRCLTYIDSSQFIPPVVPAIEENRADVLAITMDVDPSAVLSTTPASSQTEAITTVSPEPQSMSQYELVRAFADCVYDAYSKSPQVYLSSEEFLQSLGLFKSQWDDTGLSSHPHYELLQNFYGTIQASQDAIDSEVDQGLARIGAEAENNLDFETDSEGCKAHQYLQGWRTSAHLNAYNNAMVWATRQHLQQLHLPRETELFISKLKTKIQSHILGCTEYLEQQIKLCQDALVLHKDTLGQNSTCMSEEKFEEAVQLSRLSLSQTMSDKLRPALKLAVEKAVESYEQQLRLYNQQTFDAEFSFAKKALSSSIKFMENLLNSHFKQHGVMLDKELRDAFTSLCRNAAIARSSVPEFSLNAAWEAAWKDLQPSLENCWSQLRRQNQNGIRKWDREINSAIEKSTLICNEEMDQRLPNFKLPATEFDKIHLECAQHTLEKFTVSSQVNEKTRKYCTQVLELSKLEEWKQGYAMLNEKKKDPPSKGMPAAPISC